MRATYECEQCFTEYESEDEFVTCRGDACHEMVCKNCATKCKDKKCTRYVCDDCKSRYGKYLGDVYCIDHAIFFEDEDEELKNFDYVKRRMSHEKGLEYVKKTPIERLRRLK